ncbi:DNA polymerase/3'-5' exonuclease PolX [Elusimicrobiota bacterium]
MSSNSELAGYLQETADLLSFKGANNFRIRAYRDAAHTILHMEHNLADMPGDDKISELPGIGKGMVSKIKEYLESGDFSEHLSLLEEIPEGILQIMEIPGLGPKKVKLMYENLGIESVSQLEENIKAHKLRDLDGFGEKTENKILEGIARRRIYSSRILLSEAYGLADSLMGILGSIEGVEKAEVAGSLRRKKETAGDIDILYISKKPAKEICQDFLSRLPQAELISMGDKKTSFMWRQTTQVDLRNISIDEWGAALQYFTGSKEHNVALRKLALSMDLKINEYGVWKGTKQIAGKSEEDCYRSVGMKFIPPELRENMGEIDAALHGKLPALVVPEDIIGDMHVHSDYSDGFSTIEENVRKAAELGYKWVAVCDHSKSLYIANGLDESRLMYKIEVVRRLNKKNKYPRIFCGAEVDIKKDGSLDYSDDILKELDMVIAAVHSGFTQAQDIITSRIIRAMENRYVNIIAHPTGRLINEREPYAVDIHKIIQTAKRTGTALEINAHPLRLDLQYNFVKEAKDSGLRLAIGTDAHYADEMELMSYGVAVARRGWLEKNDLLNTMEEADLASFFKLKGNIK